MQIDLTSIFAQLGVLFLIMALGYVLKFSRRVDGKFDQALSKVVLDVTMPCMILASVLSAETVPDPKTILITFGFALLTYAAIIVVTELGVRLMLLPKGHRGVYRFMGVFGNVGFIGFPVLSSIFGDQALIYGAMFNIPFNILVFTLGIIWLKSDSTGDELLAEGVHIERKPFSFSPRILLTPCVISCVVVIVLCLLGIHQVPVISKACSTVGAMTTPAALMIIGSNLANMPVRDLLGSPRLYASALLKLILIPLAVWGVFHFFVTDPLLLGVMVVVSGMPVATNGTLLCFQYGGDMKTMSQGTFITTLLSFVSIPLLVMFLTAVG